MAAVTGGKNEEADGLRSGVGVLEIWDQAISRLRGSQLLGVFGTVGYEYIREAGGG